MELTRSEVKLLCPILRIAIDHEQDYARTCVDPGIRRLSEQVIVRMQNLQKRLDEEFLKS